MITFDDILEFWFVETPIGPKQAKKLSARWFAVVPAFDAEVENLLKYVTPITADPNDSHAVF